ncbi:MAG: hypothetical protein ACLVME_04660 [Ezakiella coagulans]|uniref:hypothetical protein n=1 Tax=Ezakiella coagulans TaxID=46507 RepID=UPI00050F61EE|nr:hypothetical protein [Ezakiella coagulans]KGF07313.1 hypothetical protein HMPREF1634_05755 [Tissierellia bacterium S7-1-4]UQK60768.1 hypothetical protein M1R54_00230 [Ezakiella coagulans]
MTRKDKTKDLFYNAIDYLVMLVIIIGVVIILGWKFEMLFNKSTTDDTTVVENNTEEDVKPTESDTGKKDISEVDKIDKKQSENNENTDSNPNETDVSTSDENNDTNSDTNADTNTTDENNTSDTNNETDTNKPDETKQPETKPAENAGGEVTVNIPAGTLPGATGQILADNGIVESSEAFVKKAVELGLDRKLKSGEFKLTKGMSLDAVVKAIAKQ